MNEGDQIEHRVERAVFETDRQLVVGDVTLPPEGYQSRFSDVLNRGDLDFLSLTNVEITSLVDGTVSERPFVVISKTPGPARLPVQPLAPAARPALRRWRAAPGRGWRRSRGRSTKARMTMNHSKPETRLELLHITA